MQYDVIVLGGGPAGSNFAYQSAKLGFSTLLIEKRPFAHYKCCAGAIPRELFERYLLPTNIIERDVKGLLLVSPEQEQVKIDYDKVMGATTYRVELDKWLEKRAEDAGTRILFERRAKSIKFSDDGVEVKLSDSQTLRSKVLVGASGTDQGLYQQLGIQRPDLAIGLQIELSMEPNEIENMIGNRLEFYIDQHYAREGYLWIFPKNEGVSVGLVDSLKSGTRRASLEAFINGHPIASKKLKKARPRLFEGRYFHSAMIPNGPLKRTFGERYLLVGDAAGLVEPTTWQGIYYAMRSGDLASEAFREAFDKSDFSIQSLSSYQFKWQRLFGKTFSEGMKIKQLVYGEKMAKIWSVIISELIRDNELKELVRIQLIKEMSLTGLLNQIPLRKKLGLLYKYKTKSK